MLHLYQLERQATSHERAMQDTLRRRARLEQAREAGQRPELAIRSALLRWSLQWTRGAWTGPSRAMSAWQR